MLQHMYATALGTHFASKMLQHVYTHVHMHTVSVNTHVSRRDGS